MRIEGGEIVEARIMLDGVVRAGEIRLALLKRAGVPAVAVDADQEYLLPKGAPGVTEGATLSVEVTRELIPGTEPWKRPLARAVDGGARAAPLLDAQILPFPGAIDSLEVAGWSDLLEQARSGTVGFEGGELRISATPAMTLIDVDGGLRPADLAIAGAGAAAAAIRRLDIGGSIGIDLPTVSGKAARQATAEAVDALLPKPFERTAVNGFGFLQIIRPRPRASLIELAHDRAGFEARALLRRAAFEASGAKRLVAHPAVTAMLEARSDWIDALSRQVGGAVTLRSDASLPIHGAYAEKR